MSDRDPDGPPPPDAALFGLDDGLGAASAVVLPVPFEATVSYRSGTARAPDAIVRASHQVDLHDIDVGDLRDAGIHTAAPPDDIETWGAEAREAAVRAIAAATEGVEPEASDVDTVDLAGERIRVWLVERVQDLLDLGKLPVVLGGDHSVALGAIEACFARRDNVAVLQFDAHADLRLRYEGFRFSHASVMREAMRRSPSMRLVQVGLRDVCREEVDFIEGNDAIVAFFDDELRRARLGGEWLKMAARIVGALPQRVYVSLDIDGLDPSLCPRTGTPVPGGLSFDEVVAVLEEVVRSGREIVGVDLCEVSPGAGPSCDDSWDAMVGARLLYKLIGFSLNSRRG